ncbi:MAG: hypothetical protein IKA06_00465 [Clostridia bacterium]|nr:hypothetical protein [Clostridia bacterium]
MDNNQNNFNQNNGQNEGWSYQSGQFYTPVTPIDSTAMQANQSASSSQTLGIVGLIISLICCPLIGIILGIIAISKASTAKSLLGHEPSEAKTGRICGIIAIILGVLSMILSAIIYVINMALIMEALESMMVWLPFFL